jgi:hypothetical protein
MIGKPHRSEKWAVVQFEILNQFVIPSAALSREESAVFPSGSRFLADDAGSE